MSIKYELGIGKLLVSTGYYKNRPCLVFSRNKDKVGYPGKSYYDNETCKHIKLGKDDVIIYLGKKGSILNQHIGMDVILNAVQLFSRMMVHNMYGNVLSRKTQLFYDKRMHKNRI